MRACENIDSCVSHASSVRLGRTELAVMKIIAVLKTVISCICNIFLSRFTGLRCTFGGTVCLKMKL